jgi:hypothetical protein
MQVITLSSRVIGRLDCYWHSPAVIFGCGSRGTQDNIFSCEVVIKHSLSDGRTGFRKVSKNQMCQTIPFIAVSLGVFKYYF